MVILTGQLVCVCTATSVRHAIECAMAECVCVLMRPVVAMVALAAARWILDTFCVCVYWYALLCVVLFDE